MGGYRVAVFFRKSVIFSGLSLRQTFQAQFVTDVSGSICHRRFGLNLPRTYPARYDSHFQQREQERDRTMNYIQSYDSPLGKITLAGNGKELTGLWFDGQKYFGSTLTGTPVRGSSPVFDQAACWLDIYFSGKEPDFTPPLALTETPFRKAVWDILLTVPFGQTTTYGKIASRIAAQTGRPHMSAQAVGGAVGHNPISLIVPCHRVVGTDGSLTGYAGGIDRKTRLLLLENPCAFGE